MGLMQRIQAAEIQIPTIQQIEGARFGHRLVRHGDLVGLAIGDVIVRAKHDIIQRSHGRSSLLTTLLVS